MTLEELQRLIVSGTPGDLVAAFKHMPETERKRLSKDTAQMLRAADRYFSSWPSERPKNAPAFDTLYEMCGREGPNERHWREQLSLAALAVCPFSVAKSVAGVFLWEHDAQEATAEVLSDRRPDWIEPWIEARLDDPGQPLWAISWAALRTMIKAGICRRPSSDGYIHKMVRDISSQGWGRGGVIDGRPIGDELAADPPLLEDEVWRLFEVETTAFALSQADWRRARALEDWGAKSNWPEALRWLAREGRLDRHRLLSSCLRALGGTFKQNTLGDFANLFEFLQPTPEETLAHQEALIDLLSARSPRVVSFALAQLERIATSDGLSIEAVISGIGGALQTPNKAQPMAAMELLRQVVARAPGSRHWAAHTLVRAIAHERVDVQAQALELLNELVDGPDAALAAALLEQGEEVAPSVRQLWAGLLQRLDRSAAVEAPRSDTCEAPSLDELRERAAELPDGVRDLLGLEPALAAAAAGRRPAPLAYAIEQATVLPALERTAPIASVDELIDTVARALETVEDWMCIERILDGISRLHHERPADFEKRTAPILKRLTQDMRGSFGSGLNTAHDAPAEISLLVVHWIASVPATEKVRPWQYDFSQDSASAVIRARVLEVIDRIGTGRAHLLLAMPTHAFGWIDPVTFVQRLLHMQDIQRPPVPVDLVQALLRLAPDNRHEALARAQDIRGPLGRPVRWALGSGTDAYRSPEHSEDAAIEHALWVAAGRARQVSGDLAWLAPRPFALDVCDGARAAHVTWEADLHRGRDRYTGADVRVPIVRFTRAFDFTGETQVGPLFPAAVIEEHTRSLTRWVPSWLAATWPAKPDSVFMVGVGAVVSALESKASIFNINHAYFGPLFEPTRRWSEPACLLALVGLIGKDTDSRGLAIDAIIEAIGDGRLGGDLLAGVLRRLAVPGWVKLNRLADACNEVARVSPLHAWMLADALDAMLAAYDEPPRDAHHVLELLLEILTEQQAAPSPALAAKLQQITGSSKLARLARQLCALEPADASQARAAACAQLAEAYITRGERWARSPEAVLQSTEDGPGVYGRALTQMTRACASRGGGAG